MLEPEDEPLTPEEVEWIAAEGPVEPEWVSDSEEEARSESEEEEEEEEWEDVTEFCHDGVTYYLGAGGALYDPETEERVATWDGARVVGLSELMGGEDDGEEGISLPARKLDWKRVHAIIVDLRGQGVAPERMVWPTRKKVRELAATELQRRIRGARARRAAEREAKRMHKEIEKLLWQWSVRRTKETIRRLRIGGSERLDTTRGTLEFLRRRKREEESEEWELACARGRYLARTSESRAEFRRRMDQEPRLVRVAWVRCDLRWPTSDRSQ